MRGFLAVFGWPFVICGLTVFGLIACLWGGAAWRWASWLALGAPVAFILLRLAQGLRPPP